MVLTRLSHMGEICPLSDHSYSDTAMQSSSTAISSSSKKCGTVAVLPKASAAPTQEEINNHFPILDYPNEILERILSYLSFKNVGNVRQVCKRFDSLGANILNTTFQRLQNQMLHRFQATKSQMPRRESARKKHPLARECDILETLHMRLSLLQMTFGKHIERKHCCFFAGDILDEVYRILKHIKITLNLGRAYKVTDELCELCTMAMEYFKENIEPSLPEITYLSSEYFDIKSRFQNGGSGRSSIDSGFVSEPEDDIIEREPPPTNMVLRKRIRRIRQGMKRYNTQLVGIRREIKGYKAKTSDQQKQIIDYANRLDEYDRKFEESSRKFNTLFQELNKCKTELQYWRSKSPGHGVCYNCERISKFEDGSGPSEQKTPALHGACVTSPSTVRNLEHYFDIVQTKQGKHLQDSSGNSNNGKQDMQDQSLSGNESTKPGHGFAVEAVAGTSRGTVTSYKRAADSGNTEDEEFDKRQSSDDDLETDDTVGRRVRERKRVKLDVVE